MLLGLLTSEQVLIRTVSVIAWRLDLDRNMKPWRNKTMSREFLQKQLTDKKKGLIAYGENDFGNDRQWMPKT